ncbi:MAG: hypothetical protein RL240_4164 [Planctomycetota bacterium]
MKTPASIHSFMRRQQVLGEGNSSRRSRHRAPLRSTHKIPSKHFRSSAGGRQPLPCQKSKVSDLGFAVTVGRRVDARLASPNWRVARLAGRGVAVRFYVQNRTSSFSWFSRSLSCTCEPHSFFGPFRNRFYNRAFNGSSEKRRGRSSILGCSKTRNPSIGKQIFKLKRFRASPNDSP